MILILAEPEDAFAAAVERCLRAAGHATIRLREAELAEQTPFALTRVGTRVGGFLRCRGEELRLDELSGVLVRLPRRWWPGQGFDAQDQMFVYHETTAALIALLAGLSCPVVNRCSLGWWLRDESCPALLREGLPRSTSWSAELGPFAASAGGSLEPGPLAASPDEQSGSAGSGRVSVFMVGEKLIAASPAAAAGAAWLAGENRSLAGWQRSTGISFCRLDLPAAGEPAISGLDIAPSLQAEPPELVERVGAAAAELWS
ncbi:MAG TPA: hypothetical protein VHQ90_24685 [Thermoanaerobaculia bacterium]|nr:hypothetical protein [Thermoanaerobaculia bacterium]